MFTKAPEYFTQFPKTQEQAVDAFNKIKTIFEAEAKNSREMWAIYAKAATGDATANQIAEANKKAHELLISARFATLMTLPGTLFILPYLVKTARESGVELVPTSVAQEFNI